MKRYLFIIILILCAGSFVFAQDDVQGTVDQNQEELAMYYFHTSFRCNTCRTVEAEAEKAFESLYPEKFEDGTAFFKAVNIEDEENDGLVEKYRITGQTLLVVKGDNKADLTSQGFLYAKTNPDKLKEEIRTAIENF